MNIFPPAQYSLNKSGVILHNILLQQKNEADP